MTTPFCPPSMPFSTPRRRAADLGLHSDPPPANSAAPPRDDHAFITSCLFLVCYIVYHVQVGSVHFPAPVSFAPSTFRFWARIPCWPPRFPCWPSSRYAAAWRRVRQAPEDRQMDSAIWLYVSVTGVVVYLMLYHL